jgi:hypothetical protein
MKLNVIAGVVIAIVIVASVGGVMVYETTIPS